MRIHLISDLHLEHGPMDPSYLVPDCDVVILAGDIGAGLRGVGFAMTFGKPVIMVAGNHDYYGEAMQPHLKAMRDLAAMSPENGKVYFLENDTVVIDGVRFIGATLFTNFDLHGNGPRDALACQGTIRDFERIEEVPGEAITSYSYTRRFQESQFYISEALREPHNGKTVVVTHYGPTSLSIHPKHSQRHNMLNANYASRLDDLVYYNGPDLWVHGHTHENLDYVLGETRVVCNPRGYVGYHLNEDFIPDLVLEV